MLSAQALALALAGLVAGVTGSWSPCGFSMIDTLGRRGRATPPACAAFALGAPAGGVLTFGGLALAGAALHGGRAALGVAAAIALAGAALDATGAPVAPQIRRQVPEPWRRVLPLPLAAALYGVLLGMGFTTYVLSFAVPALAAVTLALGDPALGLAVGVAFGAGRALPIIVLAPLAGREAGARALTAMAERPAVLRGARAAGAAALLLCAAVLAAAPASAATRPVVVASSGADPSAGPDGSLVWQLPGAQGFLRRAGTVQPLGGNHPALGGPWLAYATADAIALVNTDGTTRTFAVAGADALAVSARWLAWRTPGPDRLAVLDLADQAATPRTVADVPAPASLSRPSLDGDRLAYAVAGRRGSAIRALNLATGRRTVLRRTARALLAEPSLRAGRLLYVRVSARHQQLLRGPARLRRPERDRELLRIRSTTRRDAGREHGYSHHGRLPEDRHRRPLRPARYVLWTTALTTKAAYVTRLRRNGRTADIVRVRL